MDDSKEDTLTAVGLSKHSELGIKINVPESVFFNPVMVANRDVAVLMVSYLRSLHERQIKVAEPLAGSGIRALRLSYNFPDVQVFANDSNSDACKSIQVNAESNGLTENITISCLDANLFLSKSKGFNYIDIDPFGSPVPFLDMASARISRKGLIAVTATDTAALSGVNVNACRRKYVAMPIRNELMHEVALRILVRRVQLSGAAQGKALMPIFCNSTRHYMRAYFFAMKGRKKIDNLLDHHGWLHHCKTCRRFVFSKGHTPEVLSCCTEMTRAGPLWLGNLWDSGIVRTIMHNALGNDLKISSKTIPFLDIIQGEANTGASGIYDLHSICPANELELPKLKDVMRVLLDKGFRVSRSHLSATALRSDCSFDVLLNVLRGLQ